MSIDKMRVLWVVGAAERLATLGLFGGDIPLRLSPDAVDIFMQIDEKRHFLFEDDSQVTDCFSNIANSFSTENISAEEMNCLTDLMVEFKNNRTELVRYALSLQSV